MSAIAQLCEIIATGGKESTTDPTLADLIKHGFLVEAGVVGAVVCDNCDTPHSAQVIYEGQHYGYFCPDLGFVALERQHIRAIVPDMPVLIDRLANAFQCKRRKASPLHGETWRIGAAETDAGEVMLYFHPRLHDEDDLRGCEDALSREVRSNWRLFLTGAGSLPVLGAKTVSLAEAIELENVTGTLRAIADPAKLVGMPTHNNLGRPNTYAADLSIVIAERSAQRRAQDGLNAEAKAIRSEFVDRFPRHSCPSLSTVKRYLTIFRDGS
ncbi:hypothetical protein [Thalassovita sp.]|uniref:hypothetical protein n=1 Tax=Thalassovita sp. TaxID=1979401 RepID=UPI0029DE6E7C|nr:hypothetical protein [Thalassovita sp.]